LFYFQQAAGKQMTRKPHQARVDGADRDDTQERKNLIERNKELTCLYEIAKIVAHSEMTIEQVLQAVVGVLPPAFHYPENVCARIMLDDLGFMSTPFFESRHGMQESLNIEGRRRGVIEVFYRQNDGCDSGSGTPFLPEEQKLLQTIARQSALLIETKLVNEKKAELENQLRHADRLAKIGQLTAGMAHEINEPLVGILGFAQLAIKKIESPQTATRYLDRIIQSCLHAREIIKKMMLFGAPVPSRRERVDLNRLVEDAMGFIVPRFDHPGIRFIYLLDPFLPPIDADASQMTQVLVNLVINAIHAMPEEGTLTVETGKTAAGITMTVRDTGIGMAPETIDQIFLPFFTTKDVNSGTGLGLSVVHGIVSAHGGTIAVTSREGRGTTFTLTFPVAGPEARINDETR
jgi:signal transduction histidine kinase